MLRITVIPSKAPCKNLKLEGRVAGASVEELRQLCDASLTRIGDNRLTLDLADVSFIDSAGIDLFRNLCRHNVAVTHCSPFVAELLKEVLPC